MKKVIWFLVIVLIIILAVMWNKKAPVDDQQASGIKTQELDSKTASAGPVTIEINHGSVLYAINGNDHYEVTGQTPIWVKTFNTSGSPAMIEEIRFTVASSVTDTIGYLTINSGATQYPMINNYATATGLQIPVIPGSAVSGFGIQAYLNPLSSTIKSGTEVRLIIKYIKYSIAGVSYTLCDNTSGPCNYTLYSLPYNNYLSPIFKRTGSIISNALFSRMSFLSSTATLVNGTNKIAGINFNTNNVIDGQLRVKSIPIKIVSSGSVNIPNSPASMLKITNGSGCSGANLLQPTPITLFAGGTQNINAVFSGNGILLVPATAVALHVCVTNVNGVNLNPSSLTTTLGPSSFFRWQDVTGNNIADFSNENTQFLQLYPTNSSVISNTIGGTTSN